VSTYQWLLALHVTGAFFLVGGAAIAGIFNVIALRRERPSEVALFLGLIRFAVPFIGIGGFLTLVLGLWLVHNHHYSYGASWVWASVVLWMIGMALGGRGGRRQDRARVLATRLAAEGDASDDSLRALLHDRAAITMSYGSGVMFLLVLVLMVWKPGS
jgi:uncharacterized membrane protein